ncbi:MAG: UvrD-helicase domain-containing protein [Chloroflexi bacterium]|nr:UvrD-helicase domain-containing protein [Chloroflexota bacterium]
MTFYTTEEILASLNDGQRRAVTLGPGPLLVLAGPGSGKTRTLTFRAAYLIAERNVPPTRLLCVTFTNKAAEEMRLRLEQMLGPAAADIWIHTFHAACLRILRKHGAAIGLPPDFIVADEALQETIWRSVIARRNLSQEQCPVYRLRDFVSYEKAALRDPAQDGSHGEEERLTALAAQLQAEELPLLVDEAWDRLRETFRQQVTAFLRFSPDRSLPAFLDYQAMAVNVDTFAHEKQPDRVTLMTLHNAKGTEFPVVIIVGVEEDHLPLWTTLQEGQEAALAEERRVFYVGMTRAKDRLYLCSTRDWGDGFLRSPSRFAFELPLRYVRRFQMDRRGRVRELKAARQRSSIP